MKKFSILSIIFIFITSCGISNEEKERVASVTCSVIQETKDFESSLRVEKVNEAREKIKLPPYLDGDDEIKRSIKFNTCKLLITNDEFYFDKTNQLEKDFLKEQARLMEEQKAEKERIAAELRAEKERIAAEQKAEKERIAAEQKAEKERIALEQKIAMEKEKAKLLAEYNANKDNISTQALEACKNIKIVETVILIAETRKYVSDKEKKELKIDYLKSVAPNLSDDMAQLAVAYGGFRQDITSIKANGLSKLSAAKKRPVQCMDKILPPSCEAIMEIPLSLKYFPDKKSKEFADITEGMNECSDLM